MSTRSPHQTRRSSLSSGQLAKLVRANPAALAERQRQKRELGRIGFAANPRNIELLFAQAACIG